MIEFRQYSLLTLHILSWASKNINNNYSLNFNDYWGLSFIVLFCFFSKGFHEISLTVTSPGETDLRRVIGLVSSHHPARQPHQPHTQKQPGRRWRGLPRGRRRRRKGEPPHAASWHSGGWWENVHLAEIIKHERCNYINLHIATNRGNANVLIESPLQFAHNEPQL